MWVLDTELWPFERSVTTLKHSRLSIPFTLPLKVRIVLLTISLNCIQTSSLMFLYSMSSATMETPYLLISRINF